MPSLSVHCNLQEGNACLQNKTLQSHRPAPLLLSFIRLWSPALLISTQEAPPKSFKVRAIFKHTNSKRSLCIQKCRQVLGIRKGAAAQTSLLLLLPPSRRWRPTAGQLSSLQTTRATSRLHASRRRGSLHRYLRHRQEEALKSFAVLFRVELISTEPFELTGPKSTE